MKQYIVDNIGTVLAVLFGAGGLYDSYLQRKKRKTDALSGMQTAYDKFVEDYDKKFDDVVSEMASLKENHKIDISKVQSKVEKVDEHWRKKYNALKKEFDIYKKTHP
ncbi:hypothetical protein [Tenacibaculum sp. nBUS_03]|uniref:hypothetical protein n=1 Tax=Tenacibaculum sp. nBUS_03 TaxID=3395320 RepID=UPI003EBB23F8